MLNDFDTRFGHPLALSKIGFGSIRDLIRRKCLDIVELQHLKVGSGVRMGYVPSQGFKERADDIMQQAQRACTGMAAAAGASGKEQGGGNEPRGGNGGGKVSGLSKVLVTRKRQHEPGEWVVWEGQ